MNILRRVRDRARTVGTVLRLTGVAFAATFVLGLTAPDAAFAQEAAAAPVAAAAASPAPTPAPAAEAEAAAPEAVATEAAETEEAGPPEVTVDMGNNSWMLVSTLLVLLMILPGLALFYGGLVRSKNMVSMLAQTAAVCCIGMVIWAIWGYSLSFTAGGPANAFIGGFDRLFLNGLTTTNVVESFSVGVGIPELTFFAFQMTFACITACLVLGGVAERMRFSAVVLFAILWPTLVYYPIAHMVWWWPGPIGAATQSAADTAAAAGFIWARGALDFAGGTVVHINAGIAALVGAIVLGPRTGYRKDPMQPHNLTFTLIGAGLLWVGWFGFNAGSNLEANSYASLAMVNTFLATAAAGVSWMVAEWVFRRKPTLLGLASGIVAGLVAVTPAAGFAGPMGALILGLVVSPICLIFCAAVKNLLRYDDSLDAFGIHGVGGIIGALGTGLVVNPAWGGAGVVDYTTCGADGDFTTCDTAAYDLVTQLTAQATGVGVTVVWSLVGSLVVFLAIRLLTGGRVTKDVEQEGLDLAEHGEVAYHN